jgi:cobalt-zinc-cadmium efflux system outer membrane protein
VVFGASVPLPVFDHGQGPVARASADIDLQSRRVAAELAEARAELERARTVYLAERETVAKIEHDQVAQIPVLERMAQQSYQGGGTSVLELLDAFRSVKDIRVTYLERQEALKLAEESLIASAGLEPLLPAGEARK